jgi:integrase
VATDTKPRKKTWREDERILQHDVLPALGHKRLEDVRRRDIVEMLDEIVLRGAPIAANRCLAVTRKMFNLAVQRDHLQQSPCTLIQTPAKARRRERALDEGELTSLLAGLPTLPLWTPTALALLVELLTAQRSGEVIAMLWDEVDLQTRCGSSARPPTMVHATAKPRVDVRG